MGMAALWVMAVFGAEVVLLPGSNLRFTAEQLKLPGKKGACLPLRPPGDSSAAEEGISKLVALNAYWNYSWRKDRHPGQPTNMEFIPMIWGSMKDREVFEKAIQTELAPQIGAGMARRLLGFNEPDHEKHANVPYMKAIEYWPILMELNVPLCSPSCANPEGVNDPSAQGVPGTWMRDFMKEADARKYRIDYIGVHWYGGSQPESFKLKMKRLYDIHGQRPLLITEFAPADWKTGGDASKNRLTPEAVLAFAKEVLPWLEAQDWIAGYAWFPYSMDRPQGFPSALFDMKGELTALGRYYASVTTGNPRGDQSIQPDEAESHLRQAIAAQERDKKRAGDQR